MPSSGFQTCALRSEEHTSELQSHDNLVFRLLLEKKETALRPAGAEHGAARVPEPGRPGRSRPQVRNERGTGRVPLVPRPIRRGPDFFFKPPADPRHHPSSPPHPPPD